MAPRWSPPSPSNISLSRLAERYLGFYRLHLVFFFVVPLIFAGICYACNGEYPLSFIDCLFNSVSAITQTGLASSNLSGLTSGQQSLLYIEMWIGNPIMVSFVVVLVRKYYFYKHYKIFINNGSRADRRREDIELKPIGSQTRGQTSLGFQQTQAAETRSTALSPVTKHGVNKPSKHGTATIERIQPNMIRRTADQPRLVNPVGEWVMSGSNKIIDQYPYTGNIEKYLHAPNRARRFSDPGNEAFLSSKREVPIRRSETMSAHANGQESKLVHWSDLPAGKTRKSRFSFHSNDGPSQQRNESITEGQLTRNYLDQHSHPPVAESRFRGFGGFPLPHEVLNRFLDRFFPNFRRRLHRTLTVPRTTTMVSQLPNNEELDEHSRYAPYFSSNTVVSQNSLFHPTSAQQVGEIGGIEYQALNTLLWLIPLYYVGLQCIVFTIITPYMSLPRWAPKFLPPGQLQAVSVPWFSVFQTTSSISNTGMSLVDLSFLPFQTAYPMIVFTAILILAGNTAFPIFFRLMIWSISKLVHKTSHLHEILCFLLDHPRRCYIYLFPSQQTYFLTTVVAMLSLTDWFCFMVLDIGNPSLEAIPIGTRLADGLFQSIAARTAGFGIVPLAALSPAVQITYVIMMYISAFPVAMSVRSTNVYEELSLGIYPGDTPDFDLDDKDSEHIRITVWGRYLATHIQKQLAFDMWWLGMALWVVCIIERAQILDDSKKWFNIFSVLFELVSGYGTVGLSLGIPTENFSLSGSFRTLSKLVVCVVMIRGRHRGLPVAIDRAVLLPAQLEQQDAASSIYRTSTQATQPGNPTCPPTSTE